MEPLEQALRDAELVGDGFIRITRTPDGKFKIIRLEPERVIVTTR